MSIHRHITSVKRNADISVILYGSHSIPRMTSFGPKSLFEVGGLSLLNRQILTLNDSLGKYELFICSQFELEKFLNRGYKIVENQLVESNDCEDIRLALNLCSYKNVLLIDQACLLLDKVTSKFQQSFVGIGKGSEEISVNFDKKVEAFSFGGSDLKWKGIT